MKIVQINMVDFGSTGKIMLQIADAARNNGMQAMTFSTRQASKRYTKLPSAPEGHAYYGSFFGNNMHHMLSCITGKYTCYSRLSTFRLIQKLKNYNPDIIHLHNLHAAYLNLPMLLRYAKKDNIPIIWTLHDCWLFTGKCPYFEMVKCEKWKTGCFSCPQLAGYPQSILDSSKKMWQKKKEWLADLKNLTLVTPSKWLAGLVQQSFLKNNQVRVIHNGIDLSVFKPTESDFRQIYRCEDKFVILGVAFGWGTRKGLDVFVELAKRLDDRFQIVLVGTSEETERLLPTNIISIRQTKNQQELAQIYTVADLFVNPTREENYPTVNMEAIACGTPVLTFDTGGSPEIPDITCGSVVPCDNIDGLEKEIYRIEKERPYSVQACISRASSFNRELRYEEYCELYKELLSQ